MSRPPRGTRRLKEGPAPRTHPRRPPPRRPCRPPPPSRRISAAGSCRDGLPRGRSAERTAWRLGGPPCPEGAADEAQSPTSGRAAIRVPTSALCRKAGAGAPRGASTRASPRPAAATPASSCRSWRHLGLLLAVFKVYRVEGRAFQLAGDPRAGRHLPVHYLLPYRWKKPLFVAVSIAGLVWVFGTATAAGRAGLAAAADRRLLPAGRLACRAGGRRRAGRGAWPCSGRVRPSPAIPDTSGPSSPRCSCSG